MTLFTPIGISGNGSAPIYCRPIGEKLVLEITGCAWDWELWTDTITPKIMSYKSLISLQLYGSSYLRVSVCSLPTSGCMVSSECCSVGCQIKHSIVCIALGYIYIYGKRPINPTHLPQLYLHLPYTPPQHKHPCLYRAIYIIDNFV